MQYNVWLNREDGTASPAGPSTVYAAGLVAAQHKAQQTLETLQKANALVGWTIRTVTEAY